MFASIQTFRDSLVFKEVICENGSSMAPIICFLFWPNIQRKELGDLCFVQFSCLMSIQTSDTSHAISSLELLNMKSWVFLSQCSPHLNHTLTGSRIKCDFHQYDATPNKILIYANFKNNRGLLVIGTATTPFNATLYGCRYYLTYKFNLSTTLCAIPCNLMVDGQIGYFLT